MRSRFSGDVARVLAVQCRAPAGDGGSNPAVALGVAGVITVTRILGASSQFGEGAVHLGVTPAVRRQSCSAVIAVGSNCSGAKAGDGGRQDGQGRGSAKEKAHQRAWPLARSRTSANATS